MRYSIIFLTIIAVPALTHAATLKVPTQYSTIQDAINASSGGDTVLVAPGTYMENINFKGKAIVVAGEKGPDATVIDGGNPSNPDKGSVVAFQNNEGLDSILDGFTITNGTGTTVGGYGYGGGIYAYKSSPMLMNNIITLNSADWGGGGICLIESPHGRLSRNVIVHNTSGYQGGGIYIKNGGTPVVANCLIGFNEAHSDGGGCWFTDCSAVVVNCLIVNNYTIYWDGAGLWC